VALSTADANKWVSITESRSERPASKDRAPSDYELHGPIRQRQIRLTETLTIELVARYKQGATIYELAKDFDCNRHTVAIRLKKAGVRMRHSSPNKEEIEQMVRLYESGMSLAKVSEQIGYSPGTIHHYLRSQGAQIRDSHGRSR